MHTQQSTEQVTVKPLDKSMVEIDIKIPAERLVYFRTQALNRLSARLDISGFRKGYIPEKILVEHISEAGILEEAASVALQDVLPRVFASHHIDAIGRPEVTVTKLALGNPLCFSVRTTVVPAITLPDYRAIAQRIGAQQKPIVVEEHEIEAATVQIRKALAAKSGRGATVGAPAPTEPTSEAEPPPLTLEAVRSIGDFASIEDFMTRLRAQVTMEKEGRAKEMRRAQIAGELIRATPLVLPDILIEGELAKMLARLKDDLARSKNTFEAYLAAIKKTEEDLRAAWRHDAGQHAALQLIFNNIAERENLLPSTEKIEAEKNRMLVHLKNPDRHALHIYIQTILGNEAVFQFLENLC